MKRILSGAILAAAVWFTCGASVSSPTVPELEPGARGMLLTTLEGREPVEIPVRVLGTYRNFAGPGHDVHLVELEGPEAERVGAAHGMSGSPVYVEGRLVGALAYRLGTLPKAAIAGVTPIEDMLDASRLAPSGSVGADAATQEIATPVFLGGVAPVARAWLAPRLEELGFVALAGGGAVSGASGAGDLAPGKPVAVELVRGDVRVAASGTVTWVDGDVVYAFGHPFLGNGRVELPMAPADVIHTLADMAGSYHMINLGASVGSVLEDRQAGIVGRLGHEARMIPVNLQVRGGDYGEQGFRFEVVAHTELTPLLAGVSVANALLQSNGYTEKSTVLARGVLRLRDLPALPLEMAFAGTQGSDPSLAVAATVFATLRGLWDNPLEEVDVESLELMLDVRAEPTSYRVESLHYDRGRLQPGEMLRVHCLLREHRGGTVIHELSLPLPERLPRRGALTLAVGSPAGIDQALGNPLARRLQTARDLRSVIEALSDQRSAHRLTAVVYERGGAVVSRGVAWAELPPTAERLLSLETPDGRRATARPLVSPLARAEIELDGPVEGGRQLRLKIERGVTTEEER